RSKLRSVFLKFVGGTNIQGLFVEPTLTSSRDQILQICNEQFRRFWCALDSWSSLEFLACLACYPGHGSITTVDRLHQRMATHSWQAEQYDYGHSFASPYGSPFTLMIRGVHCVVALAN